MGYNKLIFVLNDRQHEITENCTVWWLQCLEAFRCKTPKRMTTGYAVWENHADNHVLLIAGGNYVTILHESYRGNKGHHQEEDQIEIIREFLNSRGYSVVRKRQTGRLIDGQDYP